MPQHIWFIGISPDNPYFYNVENIYKLIDEAPSNYNVVITTTRPLCHINYKAMHFSQKRIDKTMKKLLRNIDIILHKLRVTRPNLKYVHWETLEDFAEFNEYKELVRNDSTCSNTIYETTKKILINKNTKLDNSTHPNLLDYNSACDYLIRECAVIMNLKNFFNVNRITIAYPTKINILDILPIRPTKMTEWYPGKKEINACYLHLFVNKIKDYEPGIYDLIKNQIFHNLKDQSKLVDALNNLINYNQTPNNDITDIYKYILNCDNGLILV
jgi:tRNA-dependent cyclodipeptide synthase